MHAARVYVPYGLITNSIPFLEQSDEREAIALVELLNHVNCKI